MRRRGGLFLWLSTKGVTVKRYFGRKLLIYIFTFILAVTIDWLIPRFMPGNPIQVMISRANLKAESAKLIYSYYMNLWTNAPLNKT